jgi:hypothetical protein
MIDIYKDRVSMHRGLPFKKEEGRWSGHSGSSSAETPSPAGSSGSLGCS